MYKDAIEIISREKIYLKEDGLMIFKWKDRLNTGIEEIAHEEGFSEVAIAFRKIAEVEKHHEARYLKLLDNIEKNRVFEKEEKTSWKCNNCGYIHEGASAIELCPACIHPQAHFEVLAENY